MSELFSRLQEELRFHKSHGIDLTNPRGVVLNDKLYPAKQKGLTIPKNAGDNRSAYLDIPYESENVAKVYHQVNPSGSRKLNVSLANPSGYQTNNAKIGGYETFLLNGYRTKILHSYGEGTTNREALFNHQSWTIVPRKNGGPDWEHLHAQLKNWNNQPGESFISKSLHSEYGDDSRPMTDSEKSKHRAFVTEPIHNPNKLTLINYKSEGGFSVHDYDIETESLKPMEYDWKNKHIWGDKDE